MDTEPVNPTPHDAAALRALYEDNLPEASRAGWTLSWWRHGGEPGPDWLSDKVVVTVAGGTATGRYIRARNAPRPPFQPSAEEFTGSIPAPLAERLLHAIFSLRLYERPHPSEARAALADAVEEKLELSVGALHLVKSLYEPSRDELGALGPACEAVAAHLHDNGVRRDRGVLSEWIGRSLQERQRRRYLGCLQ